MQKITVTALPSTGFLRLAEVLKFIPVSKTFWYESVKEGRFPKPVQLGPRTAAYRAEDIAALIARLGSQSEQQGA